MKKEKAAVLIVMGQSNAHGHATRLEEMNKNCQFTNVFGLDRKDNQAYDCTHVSFKPFQFEGMNLGESQDHTACLAHYFACTWQKETDNGRKLPPLYIIQISIGAQGIAEVETKGWNMWYPQRKRIMKPGNLKEVNISLYPLACQILKLAMTQLQNEYEETEIVGLHWNQWETEADTGGKSIIEAEANYHKFFKGIDEAIGIAYPLFLYRPLSEIYQNPAGVKELTRVFENLIRTHLGFMLDLREASFYDKDAEDQGIFQEDLVHYHNRSQQWFSLKQWEHYLNQERKV